MFLNCRLYLIIIIFSTVSFDFVNAYIRRNARKENNIDENVPTDDNTFDDKFPKKAEHCWLRVNSKKHFEAMDKIDKNYAEVRKQYQEAAERDKFDEQMLEVMLKTRGAAEREIQNVAGNSGLIPAGINLGGYFMMRMPNSLLFFHRMKLRNNTNFSVTYLRNDLDNMTLQARLSLNDLHLVGSFDRSTTDKDPSILFYTPTYGQVEILLKNVQYKLEGRYRLLKDRLSIELIISDIDFDDIMLTYLNNSTAESIRLQRRNIDGFLVRLVADLDKWIKDYFNDYLMYFGLIGNNTNNQFQQYNKERTMELNKYSDHMITLITRRLHKVKAEAVKLPKFTIFTSSNMELVLKDGVLRGLDSMYRRSVATGKKDGDVYRVDAVVGFSNLKVSYQYEAILAAKTIVLSGMIILSADELTARMGLVATEGSETVDIQFDFLEQAKPESLTIEGAANRVISNFKYLLEQHVIAIMSNTLLYNIKMLESVTRCVPLLHGHKDSNNISYKEKEFLSEMDDEDKLFTPENTEAVVENTTDDKTNEESSDYISKPTAMNTSSNSDSDRGSNDSKGIKTVKSREEDLESQDPDEIQDFVNATNNNIMLIEADSANLELPSNEVQHKHRIHLKYIKNLTLTKSD